MLGPGFVSSNLAPRAVTLALKENTATAQSAIVQLEMCDLFFMARTVTRSKSGDNATRVTSLLRGPRRPWFDVDLVCVWVGLTSLFTREDGEFLRLVRPWDRGNGRVTFPSPGLP
jgi:hypothetical protein